MRCYFAIIFIAICTIIWIKLWYACRLRILGKYGNLEGEVITMKPVPKYYSILFNAVTDALKELDKQNYGNVKDLLMHGQLQAEGEYTAWMEEGKE